MPFQKGNEFGGRPKGTGNKLTTATRTRIKDFINDNLSMAQEWFDTLSPKEKLQFMVDLLPFAVSKLASESQTDSEGNDLVPNSFDWSKLDEETLNKVLKTMRNEEQENTNDGK